MKHLILLLCVLGLGFTPGDCQFAARTQFFNAPATSSYDADAQAWITAVETADGQALESGVKTAMNDFVVSLKADTQWSEIKSMTVKCGARTLAGALIDVKNPSTSWTNYNFVSGDYNRTLGLTGNGTTKYLDTGRANNTEAQNDQSAWVAITDKATGTNDRYLGAGDLNGRTQITRVNGTDIGFRSRCSTHSTTVNGHVIGFIGLRRDNSTTFVTRTNGADTTYTVTSQTPATETIYEFAGNEAGVAISHSNHRSIWCGIGESGVTLSTLDAHITTYYNAITALGL